MKIPFNFSLDQMLLDIPTGSERERAAIALDKALGIPHIPTEGYDADGNFIGSGREEEASG